MIRRGTRLAALRELERRLRSGQLVSITSGPFGAERMLERPFLSGRLSHPTGPVALALGAEAPLLPVFTGRNESGALEVTVEGPLRADGGGSRTANMGRVVELYSERLEARALACPTHFIWGFVVAESEGAR